MRCVVMPQWYRSLLVTSLDVRFKGNAMELWEKPLDVSGRVSHNTACSYATRVEFLARTSCSVFMRCLFTSQLGVFLMSALASGFKGNAMSCGREPLKSGQESRGNI